MNDDLHEYGLMLPRSVFHAIVSGVAIAAAGLFVWWRRDSLLILVVGSDAWLFGAMCFAWAGWNFLLSTIDTADIRHNAYYQAYVSGAPRKIPELPRAYESIIRGVDIDPYPPTPPESFQRDVRSFEAQGIDRAHLHMIAHRVINKEARLVSREFAPHWNGMSVGKFRIFIKIMNKKNFSHWLNEAEHRESILLTDSGDDFLHDILKFIPASPLDENWG